MSAIGWIRRPVKEARQTRGYWILVLTCGHWVVARIYKDQSGEQPKTGACGECWEAKNSPRAADNFWPSRAGSAKVSA